MFPHRYFASTFFPARYFPPTALIATNPIAATDMLLGQPRPGKITVQARPGLLLGESL